MITSIASVIVGELMKSSALLKGPPVEFTTLGRHVFPTAAYADGAYLVADNWDDFGWKTTWSLVILQEGRSYDIGPLKIGDIAGSARPMPPESFSQLSEEFFSLGQDEDYYDNLNQLNNVDLRRDVLVGLRDIAYDLSLFTEVAEREITVTSLLRSVKAVTVHTQLHRIALGGAKLSPYSFSYTTPSQNRHGEPVQPATLHFEIDATTTPKSNVHILIGRNGVGKSFILNDITTALIKPGSSKGKLEIHQTGDDREVNRFVSVISVAFSAFDAFEPLRSQPSGENAVKYTYIGLKKISKSDGSPTTLKDHVALASQFGTSLKNCISGGRRERWEWALGFLKSDPLFAESVDRLFELDDNDVRAEARQVFSELSSGHKIVLLTLTQLVEKVEEATLVLIDEPESHLHPPLLSAFIRSLTELLEDRNAAAIIVTHSPVVVQEVPSSCVWKVGSPENFARISRPTTETYGENVGTLTQEIFGLEVTASGFHRTLAEVVDEILTKNGGYNEVLEHFGGKLGSEARALAQTMVFLAER